MNIKYLLLYHDGAVQSNVNTGNPFHCPVEILPSVRSAVSHPRRCSNLRISRYFKLACLQRSVGLGESQDHSLDAHPSIDPDGRSRFTSR